MIKCSYCGKYLPIAKFYTYRKNRKTYVSSMCRDCKRKRVMEIYYIKKFSDIGNAEDREILAELNRNGKRDKSEMQDEFFKVKGKIVYSLLCWYSIQEHRFKHEFVPVAKFKTKLQCHDLVSRLRFLMAGTIKDMAREYKLKYKDSNFIE